MKITTQIVLICIFIEVASSFNNINSQIVQTKPSRQSSFEAFSKGDYEKAYSQFMDLLATYPKDPLYKYYSAVCLIKLNREPSEALKLLEQALKGGDALKSVPDDGLFYLGRAQQMSGKYQEASDTYSEYTHKAGKKVAKEMGVPVLMQQCQLKQGQIAVTAMKQPETTRVKSDSIEKENKTIIAGQVQPVVNEPATPTRLPAPQPIPGNFDKLLKEAINYQFKADSLLELAGEQRKEMEKQPGNEKNSLKEKIASDEKLAASYQKLADQKYSEYQLAENPNHDTLKKQSPISVLPPVKKDTVVIPEKKAVDKPAPKPDSAKVAVLPIKKNAEIYSLFEISQKTETDPKAKIPIDPDVPEGLIYRIQVAAFRNPVVPAYFKGLNPVYGFRVAGTDKTVYYAGMFRRSSDAGKALVQVRSRGFKDAFTVAMVGNKTVSSDRANLLEKEWGKKPFMSDKSAQISYSDTIPPTLVFRVEVSRSAKPLKDDAVEAIRKISGNKGLDIQTLEDGKVAYLIGKFITFDTAAEYCDLLKSNGFKDAQVVSWLGKKEIPIETARQLFDNVK